MLEALLRGKLTRELENAEDIVTSSVFGLMQLMPFDEGIATFLAPCRDPNLCCPLRDLVLTKVEYDFWPTWEFQDCCSCEPDVVLDVLCQTGKRFLVAVEAKFNSGKSTHADPKLKRPFDQLAREWDNLRHAAGKHNAEPILVYLTADVIYPRQEIIASIEDFVRHRGPDVPTPAICWLSWRVIPQLFGNSSDIAARMLVRLAKRLGLVYFSGFSVIRSVGALGFAFNTAPKLACVTAPEKIWSWGRVSGAQRIEWSFCDE